MLFFQDDRYVWSETYWSPGSDAPDPTVDDQAVMNKVLKAGGLADTRVQLLGAGVQLNEIRTSRDNVFRDSLVSDAYAQWANPKGAIPASQIYNKNFCNKPADTLVCEQAAEPQVVLRVRCESGATARRIMFLGGLPQFADRPGENIPFQPTADPTGGIDPTLFNVAYDKWAGAVEGDGYGYVGVQYTNTYQIKNVTANPNGSIVTVETTVAPAGINAGQTVLVFRPTYFPGSFNFHGQKEVATVAGNLITFNTQNATPINYHIGGAIKGPATRTFHAFTALIPDGIAERKRGFAELAIRGRSRPRRNFVG